MADMLITGGEEPDIDASACAYSYAELLRQGGKDALAVAFGRPHIEAEFVFEFLKIPILTKGDSEVKKCKEVILVDASELHVLASSIDPKKIVEVIDHRRSNDVHKFPNAKAQIELVGAAATLIAEKFFTKKMNPSRESAVLLYSAIVSNTINFKANLTTDRDRKMAHWLKPLCKIPDDYIHQMFEHKSTFKGSIKDALLAELAKPTIDGQKWGIVQLEILNVDDFVKKNKAELELGLLELKKEHVLDNIILTCIDIEVGYNEFLSVDDDSREALSTALKVPFTDNHAIRPGIIMRKEIIPKLRQFLEQK